MNPVRLVAGDTNSQMRGHFATQQWWAAGLLVGFLLLIFIGLGILRWRRNRSTAVPDDSASEGPASGTVNWGRLSALVGLDNRVSTSRTIALLWTVVVGYCLLALVLIATSRHSSHSPLPPNRIPDDFIETALKPLAPAYIVLLGAPFGAALGARAIVGHRTKSGSLQKTDATDPNPLDVVTDDDGNVDLVDLQYTLFSLIAATFVLTQFIPHPYRMPVIPGALATLIGVSAAVYTGNKAVGSNPAAVSDVLTPTVTAGSLVTLVGENLAVGVNAATSARAARRTTITLIPVHDPSATGTVGTRRVPAASVEATAVEPGRIDFVVPRHLPPGEWNVRVRTNAGGSAIIRNRLTVLEAQGIGIGGD